MQTRFPVTRRSIRRLPIEQTEGAKFWLKVINDLKMRGVNDILIAVVDGLKGFPETIASVYPQTVVQTCIVHLIRNSPAFVAWRDRKAILPVIKAIYRAENAESRVCAVEVHRKSYLTDNPRTAANSPPQTVLEAPVPEVGFGLT
jgi:putative transposase